MYWDNGHRILSLLIFLIFIISSNFSGVLDDWRYWYIRARVIEFHHNTVILHLSNGTDVRFLQQYVLKSE